MDIIQQLIEKLKLKPHPREGGYFAESYRSTEIIPQDALDGRYASRRHHATAIYYLLTPDTYSELHRLASDEIFHFYLGDAVEMLQLFPDGGGKIITLGNDILSGMSPQVVASRGVWQGSRMKKGGKYALLGTTVSPGFEYQDYESGSRAKLIGLYPQFNEEIKALTSEP